MIGQVQFTAALSNAQPYITGGAAGLAYGNGMLFVADSNFLGATPQNNRVLIFPTSQIPAPHTDLRTISSSDSSCYVCGYSAGNVLGQPDYVSTNPGTADAPYQSNGATAGWMQTPTAVGTDGHILAVADSNNNRVLIWKSLPTAMDQPADLVLGQSSFTTNTTPEPPTASSLSGPQGVWIQNGKLFVADTANNRILIWNSIPTSNNQPADVALGQSNFNIGTQKACDPLKYNDVAAANEMCNPVSVTSDGTHLFVADLGFNRVLIWNSIPTQMAQNADVVIGQPDMTGTVANNSTAMCPGDTIEGLECGATLNTPEFALSDGKRLYIADGGNDRVLIFNSIPTANLATADEELGQPDFVSNVISNQAQTIISTTIDNTSAVNIITTPTSLAWDGTNLYVSDPYNRRVLVFTPPDTPLPNNSVVNWASEIVRQEGVVSVLVTTIAANDTVTVTIAGTDYTYTVKKTDTPDTIAQGLVAAINAGSGDPNVTAIFAGTGTGSIYLSSKGINLPFDSISLAATTSNSADLAATTSGAYLSAGSGATAAPGMLVEIDGTNLSDSKTPVVAQLSGTLPTTLGGAQVFMDGFAAPLMSASATQIVAQVPFTFADRNSTSVYVRTVHNDGTVTVTNATGVYIAPANPGLFNAPSSANQPRPWPAVGALHQPGNPTSVVSIDGTAKAGDQATITVNGRAYTYTEASGDTLASVVTGLVNLINGAPDPQVTATFGAAFDRVVLTAIQSGKAGTGIPISGSTNSGASVTVTAYTGTTCCAVTPGSTITPSNPAAPGELITLNATGLGTLVDHFGNGLPSPTAGTPYEGIQPDTAANFVSATMGGQTAEVIEAGLPKGSYGVYQVQMVVPPSLGNNSATEVDIAQNAFVSNIVTIPVGPAVIVSTTPTPTTSTSPITINIDRPNSQTGPLSGMAMMGGWAIDNNAAITSVNVLVDGVLNGAATYGAYREDVCKVFPQAHGCPGVGWNYMLDTSQIANGTHTFGITAYGADGLHFTVAHPFTVANSTGNNSTYLFIDRPGPQDGAFQGVVSVSGWAINNNALISSVTLSVDGAPMGTANYGTASTGGPRPDVCAAYRQAYGCPYVGWSSLLNTNNLPNGTHSLEITAKAANGEQATYASSFTVANWTTANSMNISIGSPNSQSAPLSGSVVIGGWAVDAKAAIGSVQVRVDGISLGNAAYGGTRTDVCNALPGRPGCPNVGWSFILDTTLLSDGSHTLDVTATSTAGQSSTATAAFRVANFTASNPMRVHIDVPNSQSGSLSGVTSLGGWAISNTAAITGVQIYVDGALKGTASSANRNDVCAGYKNAVGCPNVGWTFPLDTTLLTDGPHMLEIRAISAAGEQGTASTSFSVSNPTASGLTRVSIDQPNSLSNPFLGLAVFSGSAVNTNAGISSVAISVDGSPVGTAEYGTNSSVGSRPDICSVYPGPGCPNVGWSFLLDTTQLANGAHTLGVFATASDGSHQSTSAAFTVANWSISNPMTIFIDIPNSQSGSFSGTAYFGGWAVDNNGPISTVSISVDGVPYGNATYGATRSDVCTAASGKAGCPNVGWTAMVDTTLFPDGSHTLGVTAVSSSGQSSTVTASFTVAN